MIRAVQTGPVIGLIGQLVVLSVIAGTIGLSATGWLVGSAASDFAAQQAAAGANDPTTTQAASAGSPETRQRPRGGDRKSTRLNSSH